MTNTSYVDPNELAALPGLTGIIPDNMGDTAGTLLDIFQRYQQEVPYGGPSGLANVVQAPTPSVLPPLMNWSGNAALSSANASTTPQEFFLGSQYTGISASVMEVSSSNRGGTVSIQRSGSDTNNPVTNLLLAALDRKSTRLNS